MKKNKILYGISGIGNGHVNRELPIIEQLVKNNRVVVFAYDDSYAGISAHFKNAKKNLSLIEVAVPFWVGSPTGLDFRATEKHTANQGIDFLGINCRAMAEAQKLIGRPDLVITDYEPVSAQYAYAHNAPLVTIDQQSKFLCGNLPKTLGGYRYQDEIVRLRMFFPKAAARIACSFFKIKTLAGAEQVSLFPPTLKDAIIHLRRQPSKQPTILVYLSSAREFVQNIPDVSAILQTAPATTFHVFVSSNDVSAYRRLAQKNTHIYQHGDSRFYESLKKCNGIISTAGHTLLSEAMYLKIPVYAIPVAPYEQYLNAAMIDRHGFGLSYPRLHKRKLWHFINHLHTFEQNIKKNRGNILLRGIDQDHILKFLEEKFLTTTFS